MKSPIYLLTALLPLTLAFPSAEADPDVEDLDADADGFLEERAPNNCKYTNGGWYYKYPVIQGAKYNQGGNAQFSCKSKDGDWWKTNNGWWVSGDKMSPGCKKGKKSC
ncbi:hypothetical protein BJX64DRAFT_294741 [Aspergillus heterothallicus]